MGTEDVKACCGMAAGGDSGAERAAGGPASEEAAQDCLCATIFREHRAAAIAAIGLVTLAILISQVGGILGIIAFFRTL